MDRPAVPREREPRGRERWLDHSEIAALEYSCPPEWWPFFATLLYTGARLGDVQGLRGADVRLSAKRIMIHEGNRRVKSKESVRDLPIPGPLEATLAAHIARYTPGPNEHLFGGAFQNYKRVRRTWDASCRAAGIQGATPHDARHTFAVHAAQAGVPIARLQELLGHATPIMTLRYTKHAPEAYLDADATAIAALMSGITDSETQARVDAARKGIRVAQ